MRRLVLAAVLALCGCGDPPERSRLVPGQRFIVVGRAHDVGSKRLKAYAEDLKTEYPAAIQLRRRRTGRWSCGSRRPTSRRRRSTAARSAR
jgi:hypothetical protein